MTKITMTDFRLAPKSMTVTFDDLEWPKRTVAEKISVTRKI